MLTPNTSGTNLDLVNACQMAFLQWLGTVWKRFSARTLTSEFVPSLDNLKAFTYSKGPPVYPFVLAAYAGIQLNTDWGGLNKRFAPIEAGRDMETGVGRHFIATPVRVGMGMQFRYDDDADVQSILTLLYSTAPGPSLVLAMADTGFQVMCRANYPPDLEPSISSSEDGKYGKLEISVVINSWMGQYHDASLIRRISVRTFDSMPTNGELQYDQELKRWYPIPVIEKEFTREGFK